MKKDIEDLTHEDEVEEHAKPFITISKESFYNKFGTLRDDVMEMKIKIKYIIALDLIIIAGLISSFFI